MPGPGAYFFGDEERKELLDVMESGYLYRYGTEDDPAFKRKVYTFEREFAEFTNARHCLAVSSGTGALIAGLAALGIGPGDEVIVPGYMFIATVTSVIHVNAIPVFAEIDESLTIDTDDIEKKITGRTKAIMPVHTLGNPCDMPRIMELAKRHGLYVIEDCCQAAGAAFGGKSVGAIGDIGAFSLNIYKLITSGDGGVLITNDDGLYERAFAFHDQGYKPNGLRNMASDDSIIGMNLKINELTGAVALAQLRKLPKILSMLREKKQKLKSRLSGVKGFGFRRINDEDECGSVLTLLFDTKETAEKFSRELGTVTLTPTGLHVYSNMDQVLKKQTHHGRGCPFVCEAYGRNVEYSRNMLPKTDDLLSRAVNISVGVVDKGLGTGFGINILSTDDEINEVAEKIRQTMNRV